jgi:hypothetical protein
VDFFPHAGIAIIVNATAVKTQALFEKMLVILIADQI